MTSPTRLIVIGAGPKALALAAKAAVLRDLGCVVPDVEILEASETAANWTGGSGHTDGLALLGTPPEKDIGFPYRSATWTPELNPQVDRRMLAYSWQAYRSSQGGYATWVDGGRPAPTHSEWADYLRWVAAEIPAVVTKCKVTRIDVRGGQWEVGGSASDGKPVTVGGDALVVTGPGPPHRLPNQPDDPRVLDGRSFWSNVGLFDGLETRVAVIGTGETAAAVTVRLDSVMGPKGVIHVICPSGTLYSRGESYWENRWYSDPEDWIKLLAPIDRRSFISRTDRGVFSQSAMTALRTTRRVMQRAGHIKTTRADPSGIILHREYKGPPVPPEMYNYVVVATGFDPSWFLGIMTERARRALGTALHRHLGPVDRDLTPQVRLAIEEQIETDLGIAGFTPRLHLPMMAGFAQGPGFPNLSCLGTLADRVLSTHVACPRPGDDRAKPPRR